jgi:hypothetical protein
MPLQLEDRSRGSPLISIKLFFIDLAYDMRTTMAGHSSDSDEEPPPYEEVVSTSATNNGQFLRVPSKLSLYMPADACYLGCHNTQPLYDVVVEYRQVIPADVEITLHSGPYNTFPTWGTLRIQGSSISVWAPKQQTEVLDLSTTSVRFIGAPGRFGTSGGSISFTVPSGNTGQLEEFEWKHGIVPDVPMFNVASPWKLVRKQQSSSSPSVSGSGTHADEETLATLSFKKGSRSKLLTIRFEAGGASGDLGDRWFVVVLLTAMAVWQRKGRQ